MNAYKSYLNITAYILAIFTSLLLPSAVLESNDPGSDDWQVDALIYLWVADINSHTPSGGEVEIDFDTIMDNFDFAFMGALEARKGKWSLLTEPVYMKISGSKGWTEVVPVGPFNTPTTVNAAVKRESWITNVGVGYNVLKSEQATLDVIAGARYTSLDVELELDLTGLATSISASRSISEHNWDGFVGVKGNIDLNDKWFVPYRFDVGAGDSDSTWNAVAAIGYRFKWGQASVG